MKKILTMAAAALLALSFTACDDKLDVTNYTSPNTGNFPATTGDVNKELNGAYSTERYVPGSAPDALFRLGYHVRRAERRWWHR